MRNSASPDRKACLQSYYDKDTVVIYEVDGKNGKSVAIELINTLYQNSYLINCLTSYRDGYSRKISFLGFVD